MKENFNTNKDIVDDIVVGLILKVRESNQAAFADLYKMYERLINKLVKSFSSMYDNLHDVEDIRQELTLAFYNSIMSYDVEQSEVKFGLYTKICMNNALFTQMRALKKRNENTVVGIFAEDIELNLSDDENTPESNLMEKETQKELKQKIESVLSPYEVKVWEMHIADFSAKEIGEELEKSEKSINNALFRIRKKLRDIFSK